MNGQGALNESLGTWDSLFAAAGKIDVRRKSPSCYRYDFGYEPWLTWVQPLVRQGSTGRSAQSFVRVTQMPLSPLLSPHFISSTTVNWAKTSASPPSQAAVLAWNVLMRYFNGIHVYLTTHPTHADAQLSCCGPLYSSGLFLGQTLWIIHRIESL